MKTQAKPEAIAAVRALGKVAVKALRYSVNGFTTEEIRELAADVAEIALDLLAAAEG